MPFRHLCDAAAPGILLAYGVGRIGCQLAGDGDWGIFNTAYIADPSGATRVATQADQAAVMPLIGNAEHTFFKAPAFLPDWLFGMTYPHNVNGEGRIIPGCTGDYCSALPVSVFPTPVYESIACIALFVVLWLLRKRLGGTLQVFATYLIMAGVERFLVELIRVNYKYDWGFIHPTQAEILSVVLVITGVALFLFYKEKPSQIPAPEISSEQFGNSEK